MAKYSSLPLSKPVAVQYLKKGDICGEKRDLEPLLTVVQNGTDLGFAAGCNIGIQCALSQVCSYMWLLNTNTVAAAGSLSELVTTEGASIGSSESRSSRSLRSEFNPSQNRTVFTRRFYLLLIPSVVFWALVAALPRFAKGDFTHGRVIVKGAFEGIRG